MKVFEQIAADFLQCVDHNLRTRALIFTPFFHPWLFIKTLFLKAFRTGARSELIQREYDRWFYDGDTIDQLPSVIPATSHAGHVLYGPQVILNTTSLLSGERVSFSREPNSGMTEMKRANRNSLPLSQVVGASSGVPVLFPPTHVYGDILVDGGVADNQGIESLLDEDFVSGVGRILLISDASGQLEAIDTISSSETTVFSRVNDILQFQIRSKLIDRLVQWKDGGQNRHFGFVHLFLNLKDRGVSERLPSEMIPAAARIRTDLDQFSLVEREVLMYHGCTLIDAQIKAYCKPLVDAYPVAHARPLAGPPLFSPGVLGTAKNRDLIRDELEAGAQKVFLIRSLKKYPKRVISVFATWAIAWVAMLYVLFAKSLTPSSLNRWPLEHTQIWVTGLLTGVTPQWLGAVLDPVLQHERLPEHGVWTSAIGALLGALMIALLAGYVLSFPTYVLVRRIAMAGDERTYRSLTGKDPGASWSQPERGKAARGLGQP